METPYTQEYTKKELNECFEMNFPEENDIDEVKVIIENGVIIEMQERNDWGYWEITWKK